MDNIKLLQEHNLKVTPQRLEILNILFKTGHINIDDLFELLKKRFPTLSLATVYKNIKAMSNKLLITEVKIPNIKNVYEIIKQEHSHIVCIRCNNIADIFLDTSNLKKQAENLSNYNLDNSSIVFSGICPRCQDK